MGKLLLWFSNKSNEGATYQQPLKGLFSGPACKKFNKSKNSIKTSIVQKFSNNFLSYKEIFIVN